MSRRRAGDPPGHVRYAGEFRWEGVDVHPYKVEGTHFRGVTRQLLFADSSAASELRYFEVAPAGHTTLERHQHAHQVVVVRGSGRVLTGDGVVAVAAFDLICVPALVWHQFRAGEEAPLGFLCLVDRERDRPQRPDAQALAALRRDAQIADFIRV